MNLKLLKICLYIFLLKVKNLHTLKLKENGKKIVKLRTYSCFNTLPSLYARTCTLLDWPPSPYLRTYFMDGLDQHLENMEFWKK